MSACAKRESAAEQSGVPRARASGPTSRARRSAARRPIRPTWRRGWRPTPRTIIARYPQARSALLPLLHLVQSEDGYLTPAGIAFCADQLGLTDAEVTAVATFYSMYRRTPTGEYLVGVCTNTLCAIMGGDAILEALQDHLGVHAGETTDDGRVTLEHVECNAACDYAPVVMVNWEFFDNQTPSSARDLVDGLRAGEPPDADAAARRCARSRRPRESLRACPTTARVTADGRCRRRRHPGRAAGRPANSAWRHRTPPTASGRRTAAARRHEGGRPSRPPRTNRHRARRPPCPPNRRPPKPTRTQRIQRLTWHLLLPDTRVQPVLGRSRTLVAGHLPPPRRLPRAGARRWRWIPTTSSHW